MPGSLTGRLAGVLVVGAAAVLAACGGSGDSRRPLAGFGEVGFEVVAVAAAAGSVAERCALAATTSASRARGLMDQKDLRGYDAMLFRFDAPSTPAFFMYRTTIPLSIAWFDAEGRFVSSADMAPCPAADAADCPRYAPTAPATVALEVPLGGLGELGIGPGSTLVVGDEGC